MKKTILIIALFAFCISASSQSLSVGIYGGLFAEKGIFTGDGSMLNHNMKLEFNGLSYGVMAVYDINDHFSATFNFGKTNKQVFMNENNVQLLINHEVIPISIGLRINIISVSNFRLFIENGFSAAFVRGSGCGRIGTSVGAAFIAPTTYVENISYGFINGLGVDYTFKSNIGLGFFVNYYSGLNTVWKNSNIYISQNGRTVKYYTVSSNGSGLQIGLNLFYKLKLKK